MGIEKESIEAKFAARFSDIAKRSYLDLDGQQTPYIQAGHADAIDAAINDHQYPTAMSILTAAENRASVVAKIRPLSTEKRESFQLPEAGSANEIDSLKDLSVRLANIARTQTLQSAAATLSASLKGRSSEDIAVASPAQ